jgi:hypothetical protein
MTKVISTHVAQVTYDQATAIQARLVAYLESKGQGYPARALASIRKVNTLFSFAIARVRMLLSFLPNMKASL